AFENGPVGQPRSSAQGKPRTFVQNNGCNLPPGEPCDPPPTPATVSAQTMSTDVIRVTYTCGVGASTLVRTSPTFADLGADCFGGVTSDSGLSPGTVYCYAMLNDDGTTAAGPQCARTLWNPYVFNGPGLSQSESDQMAASFDWTHTDPVAATISVASGTVP